MDNAVHNVAKGTQNVKIMLQSGIDRQTRVPVLSLGKQLTVYYHLKLVLPVI